MTRGAEQDGPAPAGYEASVVSQVAWQTAASTYELVSHVLMLASMQAIDEVRAIAWHDLAFDTIEAVRPPWRYRPENEAPQG